MKHCPPWSVIELSTFRARKVATAALWVTSLLLVTSLSELVEHAIERPILYFNHVYGYIIQRETKTLIPRHSSLISKVPIYPQLFVTMTTLKQLNFVDSTARSALGFAEGTYWRVRGYIPGILLSPVVYTEGMVAPYYSKAQTLAHDVLASIDDRVRTEKKCFTWRYAWYPRAHGALLHMSAHAHCIPPVPSFESKGTMRLGTNLAVPLSRQVYKFNWMYAFTSIQYIHCLRRVSAYILACFSTLRNE